MLEAYFQKGRIEAGCDEAGRGCLAGPVVAAAVILPPGFSHPMLNDSKKLSEKKREILRELILDQAVAYGIARIEAPEIDELNILRASITAMHRAMDQLVVRPEHALIDGNRFYTYKDIPHTCVVKGDGKYASIAAASILAKTERDRIMQSLHTEYPDYGWDRNKGYPTEEHRLMIEQYGITPYHRRSFKLYDEQLCIRF